MPQRGQAAFRLKNIVIAYSPAKLYYGNILQIVCEYYDMRHTGIDKVVFDNFTINIERLRAFDIRCGRHL